MAPMSHSNLINPESRYCYPDHDGLQFLFLFHFESLPFCFWVKEKPSHLCKDSSKGENSGHWESNPVYFDQLCLRAFSVRLCPDEPVLIPRSWGHKTRQTIRRIPLSLQLSSKSGGINHFTHVAGRIHGYRRYSHRPVKAGGRQLGRKSVFALWPNCIISRIVRIVRITLFDLAFI